MASDPSGYRSRLYAASLASVGTPRELSLAGGWILEREIPAAGARDGVSAYPLFVVDDWSKLPQELAAIGDSLVSLVVVTDPFGDYSEKLLHTCFPDRVLAFKEHYVVDCGQTGRSWVSAHHLRNARKACARVRVEVCSAAEDVLDDWVRLYSELAVRHAIRGSAAFSRDAFALQLRTPGIVVMRAEAAGETVGMITWYARENIGYYHLGAYSAEGYRVGASFALFDHALEYFAARGVRWLDLGGRAGLGPTESGGLERFKRGWANGTRTAYLCGRVFDRERYARLVEMTGTGAFEQRYFPAYRAREDADELNGLEGP